MFKFLSKKFLNYFQPSLDLNFNKKITTKQIVGF